MNKEPVATIVAQILDESLWSQPFPMDREERLFWVTHPRYDPIPKQGGIYRIWLGGIPVLAYIGQSKDIRRRVNELRGVKDTEMPFTDPHIAAPSLWAWSKMLPHNPFIVSFAPIACSAYWRQGLEDLAIAHARWKIKHVPPYLEEWHAAYSPLACFHKMPAGWVSSSTRAKGYRGGPSPFPSACHTPSIAPISDLRDPRDPLELDWAGYAWSPWYSGGQVNKVEVQGRGLYRLSKRDAHEILFMGHGNLDDAAKKVARLDADLLFSYVAGPWSYHEQLELLVDCLGLYLCRTHSLPRLQYGGEDNPEAGNSRHSLTAQTQAFLKQFLAVQQGRPVSVTYRLGAAKLA